MINIAVDKTKGTVMTLAEGKMVDVIVEAVEGVHTLLGDISSWDRDKYIEMCRSFAQSITATAGIDFDDIRRTMKSTKKN